MVPVLGLWPRPHSNLPAQVTWLVDEAVPDPDWVSSAAGTATELPNLRPMAGDSTERKWALPGCPGPRRPVHSDSNDRDVAICGDERVLVGRKLVMVHTASHTQGLFAQWPSSNQRSSSI